jgi:murein DD-endopeptidase MepM/ murein hydrolase activator NlpD
MYNEKRLSREHNNWKVVSMKKLRLKRKSLIIVLGIFGLLIGTYYSTEALFSGFISGGFNIREAPIPGYAFSVNNETWFVLEDAREMKYVIDEYQKPMLARLNNQSNITSIEFVEDVQITEVMYSGKFSTAQEALERLQSNKDEAQLYTVVKGDTVWDIAQRYSLSFRDLATYNSDINLDRIWPGNTITLQPSKPSLDVIITTTQVVEEAIPYTNEIVRDNTLISTARVVVKPGVEGSKNVTYAIKTLNGFPHVVEIVEEEILSEPVAGILKVGTQTTMKRRSATDFGVTNGRFSSGFGYRLHPVTGRREFHYGIDIAGPQGTVIKAYANGTVTRAQFSGGYGNYIVINHGGGLSTLYAHLSKIEVGVGTKVKVGQRIGLMGSTGVSTGSHLHFEVQRNGSQVNPLNYLN